MTLKPNTFRSCQDSSFCQRNRQSKENRQYRIESYSVSHSPTILAARVVNLALNENFVLFISSLAGGLRFHFHEEHAQERYHLPSILTPDPPIPGAEWTVTKQDHGIFLTLPTASVYLYYEPFTLSISRNGKYICQLNANNLFHMEHRKPPINESLASSETGEDDREEGKESWEEKFKDFTDSRPQGPMAISVDLTFLNIFNMYGIPEHSSDLSLPVTIENGQPTSEPYRLYNLDVFEYDLNSPFSLYGSIPFLLGQGLDGAAGVFWLNAAEMYIDIWQDQKATHSQWMAESGSLDLFFMVGDHTRDILKQYTTLVGTTALPQYFALGYHQCRWNYRDQADVEKVDATFDELGMPYDVLWLDIEHTDNKKYMTWDSNAFPDPEKMQNDLASRGRKMVVIIDPHVKRDPKYPIHMDAEKKGYYVKNTDGSDFEGHCWPGASSYLDVIRPEVRSWWAEHFKMGNYQGMTKNLYVWNDMNEPSVFNGPEITMQKDLLHNGTIEHRDIHNVYGYFYHMATNEGLTQRGLQLYGSDGDRPFVLSRAYFAGSQRLGPIWTGDNAAHWDHLRVSIPMLLSNNLAGMAFCGADVAGFFGNPDAELFTRWYQLAIFYPFFRAHAHIETKRREPWLYGEPTTSRIKRALRERYALLPYLYTLFRLSYLHGEPIMRPLWYEFLAQEHLNSQEQFMLGPALMIRPVFESGVASVKTQFPQKAVWYDAWTGEKVTLPWRQKQLDVVVDMEQIPFYYRGGFIIPRKERPRRCTAAMLSDPLTLVVALDENGQAEGEIYLDDGHSFAFRRNQYLHRKFTFVKNTLSSMELQSTGERKSHFKSQIQVERIIILGLNGYYIAEDSSSHRRIPTFAGPLRMETGMASHTLIVKKPLLSIDEDWRLQFSKAKQ